MASNALMSREEFCRMRDRSALDGCYKRWRPLWLKKHELWAQIKEVDRQMKIKFTQHLEDEKKALWWKFQDVAGELAALKADAKVRYARLHTSKSDLTLAADTLMGVFGYTRKTT